MAARLNITEKVRSEIKKRGLSRYRVSKETGVTETSLNRFMNRQQELSATALNAVCDYLDLVLVSKDELRKGS